jgi:hypothetical protein
MRLSWIAPLLAGLVACGDDDPQPGSDASVNHNGYRLEAVPPPGPSLGLHPLASVTLRVRYLDPQSAVIPGATVSFALVGEAGGSILAGFTGRTDADGIASMGLTAGASESTFKVEATAPNATPLRFEVAVSALGFANLEVTALYQGVQDVAALARLRAGLHFDASCAGETPETWVPPDRERVSDAGIGAPVRFESLPVSHGYALVIRAESEVGELLAWGCAALGPGQLLADVTSRLPVGLADVWPEATGSYTLETSVALTDLDPASLAAALDVAADLVRCPLDPLQQLLDCALDVAAPDDATDCVPTSEGDLATAVALRRGLDDPDGSRAPFTDLGDPGLDGEILATLDATGQGQMAALAALASQDRSALLSLWLRSRLELTTGPGPGAASATHRLEEVAFPALAPGVRVALGPVAGPGREAASLPAAVHPGRPMTLALPMHPLALRPAAAAWAAAYTARLAPVGLPAHPAAILVALVEQLRGEGEGCAALDALVQTAVGPDWPAGACAAGLSVWLAQLERSWADALAVTGPDLRLAAEVPLHDLSGDLVIDALGAADAPGRWLLELLVAGEWTTPGTATFVGTRDTMIIPL